MNFICQDVVTWVYIFMLVLHFLLILDLPDRVGKSQDLTFCLCVRLQFKIIIFKVQINEIIYIFNTVICLRYDQNDFEQASYFHMLICCYCVHLLLCSIANSTGINIWFIQV